MKTADMDRILINYIVYLQKNFRHIFRSRNSTATKTSSHKEKILISKQYMNGKNLFLKKSDEGADVTVLAQHGFHDRFDGIGFDFQAFPGRPVQGRNFIIPTEPHVQCTTKNIRQMNDSRVHGKTAGSIGLVVMGNYLHQL